MDYFIITVAENNVEAALFSFSGKQCNLKGAQSFVLSHDLSLSDVAAVIASGLTGNPKIVLCISPSLIAHRAVSLPLRDLRKVREVLPPHLQGEMSLPVDELVFDAIPGQEGTFLALWAKKNEIAALLRIFGDAGCEPHHISSAPFAWPDLPGIEANDAVYDGTTLCTLSSGKLSAVSTFAGDNRSQRLQTNLVALELSGSPVPSRLVVWGDAADLSYDTLSETLPVIRLELPDELGAAFRSDAAFQKLAAHYATACAGHNGTLVDFRRGDLACTSGDAKLRKKLMVTAILSAAVVLLLFVSKFMQYQTVKADITSLDRSIATIYRDVFPGRTKAVDELAEIKGEIKKLTGAGSSRSVLDLFKTLAETKGAAVNGLFEAELDGATIRLKGDAPSAKGAADFKTALGDLLSPVQLGETKSRPDGTVSFTITGTLREGK